jgi:hypothetical protein
MTEQATKLRVFVASPGDVQAERALLADVIDELNRGIADTKGLMLELVSWETHAWPGIGEDAQDVINRQIAPGDVFVGILWKRFGTPTQRAGSGTEEEFDRAYAYWKEYGRPQIMFYFNRAPFAPSSMDEVEQIGKVLAFKKKVGGKGALYWEYDGVDEFERLVRGHLTQVIKRWEVEDRVEVPLVREPPAEPSDLDALREIYLAHLRRTYRHLDFKGIPQVERVATLLPLEGVYVGLQARPELPSGETWARVAGRPLDEAALAEMGTEGLERRMGMAEPVPVERLLEEYPGLVVLGDPGAGKSTLLKVLALACAEGRALERLGLEGEWLPILLPLAAYAAALIKSEECSLLAFLPDYFCMRGLDCDLGPLLADALKRGQVLVLLDGLDEVLEGRPFVAARVEDFFRQHAPRGNRLVVTSRIVGYRDAPLRAEGLATVTLVDFQRQQIEQFAHNWCHAFEVATHGDTPEARLAAETEKGELLRAVFSNPGVERLASNPLLLTILALIKRQGVTLPHRRVELYELYLRTLITAWSQARALDRRPVAGAGPPGPLAAGEPSRGGAGSPGGGGELADRVLSGRMGFSTGKGPPEGAGVPGRRAPLLQPAGGAR